LDADKGVGRMKAIYEPKGGMCAVCEHKHDDCTELNFSEMPVHCRLEEIHVVICTNFMKEDALHE